MGQVSQVRGQESVIKGHWSEAKCHWSEFTGHGSLIKGQWSRVMIKGPRVWRPWLARAVNQVAHGILTQIGCFIIESSYK